MVDRVAFTVMGKEVYWYGIIIALATLIGMYLAMAEAKRRGEKPDDMVDFMLLALPLAIIFGRLYYVAFEWPQFAAQPARIIRIWEGGMAIYGCVIGGIVAAFIFKKWRKMPVLKLLDITIPSLILGQGLGRWGNFFNQEAFGYLVTDPKWQWFPFAVYIEHMEQWHLATFFYESVWDIAVFIILMFYKNKSRRSGNVFYAYLVLYGMGRAWIEGLRTDSLYLGPVRVSQALSIAMVLFGAIMLLRARRLDQKGPVGEAGKPAAQDAAGAGQEAEQDAGRIPEAREARAEEHKQDPAPLAEEKPNQE